MKYFQHLLTLAKVSKGMIKMKKVIILLLILSMVLGLGCLKSPSAKINIDSIDGNKVTLRNTGEVVLKDFNVLLGEKNIDFEINSSEIAPNNSAIMTVFPDKVLSQNLIIESSGAKAEVVLKGIHEDFERYDIDGPAGFPWVRSNGEWRIGNENGNNYYQISGPPMWATSLMEIENNDSISIVKFRLNKAPQEAGWFGYIIRGSDSGNGYWIIIQHISLVIRVDNNETISSYSGLDIKPNNWYWIKTIAKGDRLKVYLSDDGSNYKQLIDTINKKYDKGKFFGLAADPSGYIIDFDELKLMSSDDQNN